MAAGEWNNTRPPGLAGVRPGASPGPETRMGSRKETTCPPKTCYRVTSTTAYPMTTSFAQ